MTPKELIAALEKDPSNGDWFWPVRDPEKGESTVDELIDLFGLDEPFEAGRSVQLSSVWVVPYRNSENGCVVHKEFHTQAEAQAFFGNLKKAATL